MKMPKINLLLLFHTLHSLHDILCLFPKLDMYLNPAFSCLKRFFLLNLGQILWRRICFSV